MFCTTITKSFLTENNDFWKLLRRNFVVSFRYLLDSFFWFFEEIERIIHINEEIIRHNIDFDVGCLTWFSGDNRLATYKTICTMKKGTNICKIPQKTDVPNR